MDSVLKLRPEELFFLGDLMDGHYIDYAYIEAMHDIEKNYDALRSAATESLARAGIIRKRFSGEITVEPDAKKLLHNVFESKRSGEILLQTAGEEPSAVSHRYHFGDSGITEIVAEGEYLTVSAADPEQICKTIAEALGTHAADAKAPASPDAARITRMISAKHAVVGEHLVQLEIYEQDGALFRFISGIDQPQTLTDGEAAELLRIVVTGE